MRDGGESTCRRRSSLILAALMAVAVALSLIGAPPAGASGRSGDPLVDERGGATIDWRRGLIEATGGAAADHRMPSADVARPGAERRAQAIARAHLVDVLKALPLGGARRLDPAAISRAVGRARSAGVDYQSNGGAVVRVELGFADLLAPEELRARAGASADAGGPAPAQASAGDTAPIPLWLPEGRLAAVPVVVVAGREIAVGGVRYAPGAGLPAGVKPVVVHADKQGRLVVDGGAAVDGRGAAADGRKELAGRPLVIYVQKILR